MKNPTDLPFAVKGLKSYRYRGYWGYVMIGATDTADALREAQRSIEGKAIRDNLEFWDGEKYCPLSGKTVQA